MYILHSSPVKKGLFSLHRRGENEARSQTAGRNALAAVNPEGAERQALSKSSQLPSPKPLHIHPLPTQSDYMGIGRLLE